MQINLNPNSSSSLSLQNTTDLLTLLGCFKTDSSISFNLCFQNKDEMPRTLLKEIFRVTSENSRVQISWSSALSPEDDSAAESEIQLIGFKLLKNSGQDWELQKQKWNSQAVKPKKKLKFPKKKKKKNPFAKKGAKTRNKVNIQELVDQDVLAKNEIPNGASRLARGSGITCRLRSSK